MAKEDFNLGSSSAASFISSLRTGLSSLRQEMNLLKQETGGWSSSLGTAMNRLNSRGDARFGGGSPNQVAPYPVFSVDQAGQTTRGYYNDNVLFSQGAVEPYRPLPTYYTGGPTPPQSRGGGGLTPMQSRAFAGGAVGAIGAMPNVKEAVEYELATQRMVFFQQQASFQPGGRIRPFSNLIPGNPDPNSDYARATALLQELGKTGTVTGKFDTVKAMEAARQLGIGGPNFANVAMGAAAMSNITPGIGVEGSMRAYGAVQQARNVNMLRGIGIRIRGEDGSLKPMPQIIDEIWNKLNREKMGSEPITVQDVQISLQPGNALASMLDQYFGNDPLLRKQVEDGLMLKARSGGATFRGADLKKLGEKYGATTPAVSSLSQRITESTKTLQQVAPVMSDAFTAANRVISAFTGFINLIDRFTGIFSGIAGVKGGAQTLFSGGSGSILGGISGAISSGFGFVRNLFRAEGGPVDNKMPYIVGEQGPELFVPEADGKIVPNHELKNYPYRHEGGPVHNKTHNAPDTRPKGAGKQAYSQEDMIDLLKQAGFEGQGLQNALKIAQAESGNRPYAFNPHGGDLSYGLFQINMLGNLEKERLSKVWRAKDGSTFRIGEKEDLYDGLTNAKIAYHMSKKGYDWSSWTTKSVLSGGSAGGSGSGASENVSTGRYDAQSGERFSMGKFLSGTENSNRNLISSLIKGFTSLTKPENKTSSQAGSQTYNYGGVTVNLTGGGSPEANVAALKAALSNTEVLSSTARN